MILDEIVAYKRVELAEEKRRVSLAQLKDSPLFSSPSRPFRLGVAGTCRVGERASTGDWHSHNL